MKVVALLSGGIDSPVAAYLMLRMGAEVIPVHMHVGPKTDEKVKLIARKLGEYGKVAEPVIINPERRDRVIGKLREMKKDKYTCVLCKFNMVKAADDVARETGAKAIVMGDSIGQVASQTLDNILIVSRATGLPILRPLIGLDKEEIVRIAKEIGTFELSTLPEEECWCVPRHPIIRGSWGEFARIYRAIYGRGPDENVQAR
jgi:thiamine biosynthesis protein ThiI